MLCCSISRIFSAGYSHMLGERASLSLNAFTDIGPNRSLGVYATVEEVPVRELMAAGATVALGADDPLLFGTRLAGQYALLRAAQDFTDAELAELALGSWRATRAPQEQVGDAEDPVHAWLAAPDSPRGPGPTPVPELDR